MQLADVEGFPAPFTHCPRTILLVARKGATYTALSPRRYPIRYTARPAWMQGIIDQEELGNTQEREARAGRLAALAATEPAAPQHPQPAGWPPSGDECTPEGDGVLYRGDPPCLGGPAELQVAGAPEEGGPATWRS